ncbi:hypothetical protein AKO1_013202 [Acrasis kona]
MFCYHLGTSLFEGQVHETVRNTAIECPKCEFKFTNVDEAGFDVKIIDNVVHARLDASNRNTGRPVMSNIETLDSFVKQHQVQFVRCTK